MGWSPISPRIRISKPSFFTEAGLCPFPDAEYIYAGGQRIAKLESLDGSTRPAVHIEVESAGFTDGNFARIWIDGVDYAPLGAGYNLVVIDETSGAVVDQINFNPLYVPSDADAMAAYIDDLPHGRIVLGAVRNEASTNMNENAYLALESLGSAQCRDVGYRDAHAFIGRKGAQIGSIPEMHAVTLSGPAETRVHIVDCFVQSAGFEDGNFAKFLVNGVSVGTGQRGYNLVVINQNTGIVENEIRYDTAVGTTNANNMASFINALPTGRIVLVAAATASAHDRPSRNP